MAPVTAPIRRGRPREWPLERIEKELLEFTNGSGRMPTMRELDRAGRKDLRAAIVSYGGVPWWADACGLSLRLRQRPPAPPPEELVEDARKLIGWLGYLPGANKLRQLDRRDLALAVLAAEARPIASATSCLTSTVGPPPSGAKVRCAVGPGRSRSRATACSGIALVCL